MSSKKRNQSPSFFVSLIPLIATGLSLGLSVFIYDAEPHLSLFIGACVAGVIAYLNGYPWKVIQEGFVQSISRALPSLIILLIIGMLIGVWISNGIVPILIYYGFEVLIPSWFLPVTLIFCSFMSVITGSSWTTAGTIGVAAIGIGQGLGIPAHITAGVVVSGSFFGDKISPMSDSTNLTPSIVGVDLYEHIKHMLYTTVPSFLVALIAYTILGFFLTEGTNGGGNAAQYQEFILEHFDLSIWLMLPPLIVITMVLFKVPAIPSLATGVFLGGLAQIFLQGQGIGDFFHVIYEGYSISTDWSEMDELLSRGGMTSMYSVVSLGMMALSFGGIMNRCGMLSAIVHKLSKFTSNQGKLTALTLLTSIIINIFGANQYLAVILPGQMYEDSYENLNLHPKNLTRALEGGGTLTAPLIPWNSSGVFMLSALSINPLAYAPYALICWLTPLVVLVYGYMDVFMTKLNQSSSTS